MSTTWPPTEGLCSPTVSRKDAVFSIYASTTISASAASVLETVLNVDSYPQWNTFIPKASITSQPPSSDSPHDLSHMQTGSIMTFHAVMNSSKPQSATETSLQVTDISTPEKKSTYIDQETLDSEPAYTADLGKVYRVCWKSYGGFASRGLRSERFHEVIVKSENECEVRTWEVMGGALANVVKWMYHKTLQQKFQLWVDDLKKYCEGGQAASSEQ
ncbi:hypothetical protein TI39_contig4463g00001 [Zymoseptoria brevis]|uniref:Coenzyme Q-binding protein COQ10 START domain-containing protein n=1 Tax=Zymoseptoria brevis TaxID=1047168 RepID=A0A0F4G7M8_9PEZI|nr:hypothetical protein TI39_contig4463g00001 [Zymoseptoria brevis]